MSFKDISDKVPNWIVMAALYPVLSPDMQNMIRGAVEEEQNRQIEQSLADSVGLTIEEYRQYKALSNMVSL